jgi:hypothetical protein
MQLRRREFFFAKSNFFLVGLGLTSVFPDFCDENPAPQTVVNNH